jgi:hypothetical protein
MTHGTGEIIR